MPQDYGLWALFISIIKAKKCKSCRDRTRGPLAGSAKRGAIQNACFESFNGRFREECPNEHWFVSLGDAGAVIDVSKRYCISKSIKQGAV